MKKLNLQSALRTLLNRYLFRFSFFAVLIGLGIFIPTAQADTYTVTVGAVPTSRDVRSLNDDRVANYNGGTGNYLRSALLAPANFGETGSVVPDKSFSIVPIGSDLAFTAADLDGLDAFSVNFNYTNLTISESEASLLHDFVMAGGYLFVHVDYNKGPLADILTSKFGVHFNPAAPIQLPNGDFTSTPGITTCTPLPCAFSDPFTGEEVAGKTYPILSDAFTLITGLPAEATPLILNQTDGRVWAATIAPGVLGPDAGGVFFWGNDTNESLGRSTCCSSDVAGRGRVVHLNAFNAIPGKLDGGIQAAVVFTEDFESYDITSGSYRYFNTIGDGWNWTGFTVTPNRTALVFNNNYDPVGDGEQSVQLEYQGNYIEQAFSTNPGQTYTLTFLLSGYGAGIGEVAVDVAGQPTAYFSDPAGPEYTSQSLPFTATSVTTTLRFTNNEGYPYTSKWTHLDNICVRTSDEPLSSCNPAAPSLDTDGDTIADDEDNCPDVANPDQEDNDMDGVGDACDGDDDNDGVLDGADNCPFTDNPLQENTDATGAGDACNDDIDGDEVDDAIDICPNDADPDQTDTDGDGAGDACDTDDDGDGYYDMDDNCPTIVNAGQEDLDDDGIGNDCDADQDGDGANDDVDNCPITLGGNANQTDTDGDGDGDVCDADDDNDGMSDGADNCPLAYNVNQADADGDGTGDACNDAFDDDGDEWSNDLDNCPNDPNGDQADLDGDMIGDVCDTDVDGDGIANGADNCAGTLLGNATDGSGCTIDQLCPCAGPRGMTTSWKNHGKYVSCVAHAANDWRDASLIDDTEHGGIVSAAGQSNCGGK